MIYHVSTPKQKKLWTVNGNIVVEIDNSIRDNRVTRKNFKTSILKTNIHINNLVNGYIIKSDGDVWLMNEDTWDNHGFKITAKI